MASSLNMNYNSHNSMADVLQPDQKGSIKGHIKAELANQMILKQNDPFPVANMNYWVTTNLTYILDLSALSIALSITACYHRHNWLVIRSGRFIDWGRIAVAVH